MVTMQAVLVDRYNAFEVNGVGPGPQGFPLTISTYPTGGGISVCYLRVQTTDADLPGRLLARLMAMRAGVAVRGDDAAVMVPHPPADLVDDLLHSARHWAATVVGVDPVGTVTMAMTPRPGRYRLGDPIIQTDQTRLIIYDRRDRTWHSAGRL